MNRLFFILLLFVLTGDSFDVAVSRFLSPRYTEKSKSGNVHFYFTVYVNEHMKLLLLLLSGLFCVSNVTHFFYIFSNC